MNTLETLKIKLRDLKPKLQQDYQVTQLGLFGSYVRGEQTENSDIDILVEFAPEVSFGLVTFCTLENQLSDSLGQKVDLVMKDALKPHIGKKILEEVIYL
ncbi:nucleotidyltransferase family protein [Leptothoe spongobia]|uniref:Nucleotidyltransferase family protein n=1 Tax=Leptothoe spongobia TAU-MAC 1115 TaxID=1967444 RepID=A0A947DDL5_9CYAN|nr:nucleotidyltransferase family protein [Leptothoe spongobia]MBT9314001.1 nucleotidyltransferase family protein [Leptothoe spongobia TAU-MAC 1115]